MKVVGGVLRSLVLVMLVWAGSGGVALADRTLAYIVSDQRIPFWHIMRRGVETRAAGLGYRLQVFSASNDARRELASVAAAIREKVDGIILSPTNSSAAVTILKLAGDAGIPVVIADIGSESGEYVSYVASDNFDGSYRLGQLLAKAMQTRQWADGSVGIIAIPQRRANGRARTAGFLHALEEAGIKSSEIRQQVDFSYQETYDFAAEMIAAQPQLRALWLQGSDRYQGALDAIADAGKRGEILLVCFDAEPEFLDLIARGVLVGAGMQQPFRMGEEAVAMMNAHLQGDQPPQTVMVPVLTVSADNVTELLPVIQRNVFGQTNP